ncbi:spermatogenesis-associated protein 7-like isoform X9 [Pseudophryne corroboree]|uniref:spermatogenesis-associated protein 7-like isoform X9 n=1 Tax=Pseudophryne corroboree TaxID=495146 RepID=UPI0030812D1D
MAPVHYETPMAPISTYSMLGPFKGHMSLKSSPLYPGSSCSLSTQFIIQDHMATHYRRLSSAKAAVDTSAPKSLSSSVKFRDQQNKERLLRAVHTFRDKIRQICSTSTHQSHSNFPGQREVHYGHREMAGTENASDVQNTASRAHSPVLIARDVMASIEQGRHCDDDGGPGPFQPKSGRISLHHGLPRKKTYKDPQKQTYSGDLLEKHAASFTRFTKPGQPRLLRKPAQSVLSQYRYYTAPAKRKTTNPLSPPGDKRHMARETQLYREEDLKHLRFLEALTSDLVRKGCESNGAMENVFQDHLTRNGNIDEVKKEVLVQELREELERSVKLDFTISYDGRWYGSENLPLGRNLSQLLNI